MSKVSPKILGKQVIILEDVIGWIPLCVACTKTLKGQQIYIYIFWLAFVNKQNIGTARKYNNNYKVRENRRKVINYSYASCASNFVHAHYLCGRRLFSRGNKSAFFSRSALLLPGNVDTMLYNSLRRKAHP